jgi:hypothetical protein
VLLVGACSANGHVDGRGVLSDFNPHVPTPYLQDILG